MTALAMRRPSLAGWILDRDVDAKTTMLRMAKLARAAMTDAFVVRYANEIIAQARPRDYRAQIEAIRRFMLQWFHFVDNPIGVQRIEDPRSMIDDIESARGFTQGACDDAAVLVATLGMANGIPARFRALAFAQSRTGAGELPPFTHVIADLWNGREWEPLDVTKPRDMRRPPVAVRELTVEIPE